jgi:hypothetical protein
MTDFKYRYTPHEALKYIACNGSVYNLIEWNHLVTSLLDALDAKEELLKASEDALDVLQKTFVAFVPHNDGAYMIAHNTCKVLDEAIKKAKINRSTKDD